MHGQRKKNKPRNANCATPRGYRHSLGIPLHGRYGYRDALDCKLQWQAGSGYSRKRPHGFVLMASKIARDLLAANGVVFSHDARERSNFATGRGTGKLASPYHVVATGGRYGSAKRTIGWATTEADAYRQANLARDASRANETSRDTAGGGADYCADTREYFYVVDIRTNSQDIDMARLGFNK